MSTSCQSSRSGWHGSSGSLNASAGHRLGEFLSGPARRPLAVAVVRITSLLRLEGVNWAWWPRAGAAALWGGRSLFSYVSGVDRGSACLSPAQ